MVKIKLGGLLTDKQVAQIGTLINAFKEEFNAQKSDSLANEYMTAFAKQQLPPPAPAPAIEQSQINGGPNRTGANITGDTDGIVIKPHQQEDQQDTGPSSSSDATNTTVQALSPSSSKMKYCQKPHPRKMMRKSYRHRQPQVKIKKNTSKMARQA